MFSTLNLASPLGRGGYDSGDIFRAASRLKFALLCFSSSSGCGKKDLKENSDVAPTRMLMATSCWTFDFGCSHMASRSSLILDDVFTVQTDGLELDGRRSLSHCRPRLDLLRSGEGGGGRTQRRGVRKLRGRERLLRLTRQGALVGPKSQPTNPSRQVVNPKKSANGHETCADRTHRQSQETRHRQRESCHVVWTHRFSEERVEIRTVFAADCYLASLIRFDRTK